MSNLLSSPKKKLKSWLIDRVFSHSGSDYQRDRFPHAKFDLIASHLDLPRIGSVLDIGCNEGFITSDFAKRGKFAVGVDVAPHFINHMLKDLDNVYGRQSAALGVFPLSDENVEKIPPFDLILLLSVHHQLMLRFGNEYTSRVVTRLIDRATQGFVIEFAATAEKYGFKEPMFLDNDETSVRAYAERWLRELGTRGTVQYIGKNREHGNDAGREPYRFLYLITKQ